MAVAVKVWFGGKAAKSSVKSVWNGMDPPKKVNWNPPRGSAKTLHFDNGLAASTAQEPVEPKATFVSSKLSDVICAPALSSFSKRHRGELVCVAPWIRMHGLVAGLLPDGDSTEKLAREIADAPPPLAPPMLIVRCAVGVAFAAVPFTKTTIAKLRSIAGLMAHPLRPIAGNVSPNHRLFSDTESRCHVSKSGLSNTTHKTGASDREARKASRWDKARGSSPAASV